MAGWIELDLIDVSLVANPMQLKARVHAVEQRSWLSEAALVKSFPLMAATLLLFGCHRDRGNNAEAALAEAYLEQLQGSHPGMTDACVQKIRTGEIGLTGWIDSPACFEMLPDQRWSGRWDSGWEWSIFCPDGTTKCEANRGIWLESKAAFPRT